LIDADALIKQVKAIHKAVDASRINTDFDTGFHSATSQIMGLIAYIPTIEAVPVVYGEWVMRGGKFYCTNCGKKALEEKDRDDWYGCVKSDWCPRCGADMRKKV
jgi:hypothetical protein